MAMVCPTCSLGLEQSVEFCPRCGWPAGRLQEETPQRILSVPRVGCGVADLRLRNTGAGPVEYTVALHEGQPWADLLDAFDQRMGKTGERRLEPGETDNSLRVGVRGEDLPENVEEVVVDVESADLGGRAPTDYRPWSVSKYRWRRWSVRIGLRRLGPPLVFVGRELVIFTTRQREAGVRVHNLGGSPTTVMVQNLPEGVRATWQLPGVVVQDEGDLRITVEDRPVRLADGPGPQEIAPGVELELVLEADGEFEGLQRAVVVGGDGSHWQLTLYGEPSDRSVGLLRHWTAGIDFGTSKSAVFLTDNWKEPEQRQPVCLKWPPGPGIAERSENTTRSAVMYRQGEQVPACGHEVPVGAGQEGPGERVIESIKSYLGGSRADEPITLPGGRQVTPVQVVADFMRYLLRELRGAEPFRGQHSFDAHFVLSLPVLQDRQAFLTQREHTLQAASQAGLPVSEMATPSEPECALLDLLHALRRGRFVFGGEPYQLQDRENVLILDSGAGTTDIAVLQVILEGGRFAAEQKAGIGYPFGGDVVDDLLMSYLLEQVADRTRFGLRGSQVVLQVEGLPGPMPVAAVRAEVRRVKESLFGPLSTNDPQRFHTDIGDFDLARNHVETLIGPHLASIFRGLPLPDPRQLFPRLAGRLGGIRQVAEGLWRRMFDTAGHTVRPLPQVLAEAGFRPGDITFLFVTGGNGQIRAIAHALYDTMGRCGRVVLSPPDECTIVVARGAALYYDYRISGLLRCGLDVVGRDLESGQELFRQPVLSPGALPGPDTEHAVRLGPRQRVVIALTATYPDGGPAGDIARQPVLNTAGQERQVVVRTRYDSDRSVGWRLAFADGQPIVALNRILRT